MSTEGSWLPSFHLFCLLDDGSSIIAFYLQIEAISAKLEVDEKELRMYSAEIDALKVRNIYTTSYITKNVLGNVSTLLSVFSESILCKNIFNRITYIVFLHKRLPVVFENQ